MNTENSLLDDILKNSPSGKSAKLLNQNIINSTPSSDTNLSRLYLISKGYTQAIFKITSYGKGSQKVAAHLSYISRNGKLELEDQDGNFISGLSQQKDLVNDWALDFGDSSKSRDTLHLVLSTPEDTSPEKAIASAREFLASEFGHTREYVFAVHIDTNNPHIHAAIKMKGYDGLKPDPRKADLARYRKNYADICLKHGIKVEASRRYERGLCGKSTQNNLYRLSKRGKKPRVNDLINERIKAEITNPSSKNTWEEKISLRNQVIRRRYIDAARKAGNAANNLVDQNKKKMLQDMALSIDSYAKKMPIETSTFHAIKEQAISKNPILSTQSVKKEVPYEAYLKAKESNLPTKNEKSFNKNNKKDNSKDVEIDV